MIVEPLAPDDAPALISLAREWGHEMFLPSPGAYGAIVRSPDRSVLAFGFLRQTGYGFAVDDLWCAKSTIGRAALGQLARWLERTVARIARERNVPSLPLGGIARRDNPTHCAALEKRGYEFVAKVYAKDIPALAAEEAA